MRAQLVLFVIVLVRIALLPALVDAQDATPNEPEAQALRAPPAAHGVMLDMPDRRSPGLAAALSLMPLPADFGNLYAEDVGWGIAFTALELSLMMPMIFLVGGHMDHGRGGGDTWSSAEERAMVGLVAGYVVIKLVAGLHAASAAEDWNARWRSPYARRRGVSGSTP